MPATLGGAGARGDFRPRNLPYCLSVMRPIINVIAIALLAATQYSGAQTSAGAKLRAGAAKIDITEPEKELLTVSSDSVRDHLYARAIVVDDGITCAVLVGLDQSGVDDVAVNGAVAKAAVSTKCPVENFI